MGDFIFRLMYLLRDDMLGCDVYEYYNTTNLARKTSMLHILLYVKYHEF